MATLSYVGEGKMFNIKKLVDIDNNRGQNYRLEILDVEMGQRETLRKFSYVIEAPN